MLVLDIPAEQEPRPRSRYYNFFPRRLYWPDQLSKRSDKTAENELNRRGRISRKGDTFLDLKTIDIIGKKISDFWMSDSRFYCFSFHALHPYPRYSRIFKFAINRSLQAIKFRGSLRGRLSANITNANTLRTPFPVKGIEG